MKKFLYTIFIAGFFLLTIGCSKNIPAVKSIEKPVKTEVTITESTKENSVLSTTAPEKKLVEKENASNWIGEWTHIESSQHFSSSITIKTADNTSLKFTLDAHNGANLGNIEEGTARIAGNTAVFQDIELGFKMTLVLEGDSLNVSTEGNSYFGAGVFVDGMYKQGIYPKVLNLTDIKVFENTSQEERFASLVGDSYEKFRDSFQSTAVEEDLDGYGAKVYSGWVRGLANYQAAIIMYTPEGKTWAAVVDENEIKYFTNTEDKDKLPKTIEDWSKKFDGSSIKYMNK
jgi:hypothetical protein